MYKKIFILIILFLLTGCNSKSIKTETVIEYDSNIKLAINYPITNIKQIDNLISNYIDDIYNNFKNDYINNTAELNISYSFNELDKYISISLTTFISSNALAHPLNEIYTIVYDKSKKRVLKLGDLLNEDEIEKEIPRLKKQLDNKYKECLIKEMVESRISKELTNYQLFLLNENNITIFFNPYDITSGNCNIISINIPIKLSNQKSEDTASIIPDIIEFDYSKPTIALTFDDGPSKYTKKIIDLLKKYNAPSTFFVIGNKVEIYKDTIKLMYKNGNEIANHSYDHKWLTRLDDEDFFEQINKTQNAVKKVTGFTPKLLRPTYGSINNKIRKNSKLDIIMWDVDTRDWEIKNAKKIANKALASIEDGDIILMHDVYERTYRALEIMLPKLKEQGFQFVTVSKLKQIKELKKQNN